MIPSSRQRNTRRLVYYLIGVAIGCVLLGVYFQGRQAQVARRLEAERAEQVRMEAERGAEAQRRTGPGAPAPAPPGSPPGH